MNFMEPASVGELNFLTKYIEINIDSSSAKSFNSTACDFVWISHRNNNAREFSVDDCFGARRRTASVIARLKGYINRCTLKRLLGTLDCNNLGMIRRCLALVKTFTDDCAGSICNYCANNWIRICLSITIFG